MTLRLQNFWRVRSGFQFAWPAGQGSFSHRHGSCSTPHTLLKCWPKFGRVLPQVIFLWQAQCLVNCGYCLERLEAFVWGNIAIVKMAILRSFLRGRCKGADAPGPFFVHSKSVFLADGEKVANRIGTVTFNAAASDIDAWSPILARCSF